MLDWTGLGDLPTSRSDAAQASNGRADARTSPSPPLPVSLTRTRPCAWCVRPRDLQASPRPSRPTPTRGRSTSVLEHTVMRRASRLSFPLCERCVCLARSSVTRERPLMLPLTAATASAGRASHHPVQVRQGVPSHHWLCRVHQAGRPSRLRQGQRTAEGGPSQCKTRRPTAAQ
jgi:hypothetical protein